jgi:Alpha-kinase family
MNLETNYCVQISPLPFKETEHSRLRREQRGIDKKDLEEALIYGTRYQQHSFFSKYEYKDITYIVNDWTGEEVTSYAKPLELEKRNLSANEQANLEKTERNVRQNPNGWTSNTVIVVDTSGSMKQSDVWGTRNRLGAVWVSLALDCIAHGIETGGKFPTDVVSIITLCENPKVLVEEMPWTWLLYNEIVDTYENKLVVPCGHGPFIPSLKIAAELLTRNANSSCALGLMFLSDGAPSDMKFLPAGALPQEAIKNEIGKLASAFGRRLTFTAIGVGHKNKFQTLEMMVDEARDYEVKASLELPSLTSVAIGASFTASVTSTLETQRELTDVETRLPRLVRNVYRESKTKASIPITKVSHDEFWIYNFKDIERKIYVEHKVDNVWHHTYEPTTLQHRGAAGVAMAKAAFGEGVERFAFRFYELASDLKTIVGSPMVAKESRFIMDANNMDEANDERIRYVRTFCNIQQKAARIAKAFNHKLDRTRIVDADTPRVRFLDCSIYELKSETFGLLSVLVEEKLDHMKWQKWNSNNGYIQGGTNGIISIKGHRLGCPSLAVDISPHADLGTLFEGSDDDEESIQEITSIPNVVPKVFSSNEVAQAFSHFSYLYSCRLRLVCDLQGVFNEKDKMLLLTDPVIHFNPVNHKRARRRDHGRTDRGEKGMKDFFDSHYEVHGHLCRLILRGFRPMTQNTQLEQKTRLK